MEFNSAGADSRMMLDEAELSGLRGEVSRSWRLGG